MNEYLLSNKQLIVSAERDDALGEDSGAVYIFERTSINDTTWHQAQKITAPDAQANARFGTAIKIQNNTLYIGAPGQGKQGKVYIFQLNQKGNWFLTNTIEPTDPQAQKFGTSIAVNENTLAIGAPYTDANTNAENNSTNDTQKMRPRFVNTRVTTYDPGIEAGAIFVYQLANNNWQENTRLGVQERYSYEHFGTHIALKNKVIAGSIEDRDVVNELGAGAVFIFRKQADIIVYNDKKVQITLGNIYSSVVNDCTSEIKIRGFDNVMSRRNISEELNDESVNLLLEEVENAYPIYQRYLKVKAKLLGKTKLKNSDLLAPISKKEKEYKFEEGLKIFLDVIKEFDEEFYNYSVDMFEDGRVDVFPKEGKRGGAFAQYVQGFESFVMLNYTNKLNDISTLAHELGHAMHGHLSQIQKSEVFSSGLSLAETASVFNEMILSQTLIKKLEGEEKLEYLEEKLSDISSTIFRQIQYILFEKRVHQTILSGEALTYKDFNIMWREEQIKMCGDLVEYDVPAEDESSWSSIPHIFRTPFYCYSYAFGNILTFALFNKYKEEGKPFVEKYKNILRAGGSKVPYDLLKENGLDINSREYFRGGIKVIEELVEELEKLC